jgi:hypothetical protein
MLEARRYVERGKCITWVIIRFAGSADIYMNETIRGCAIVVMRCIRESGVS